MASWKEKKDYLTDLIKKISVSYGGDDENELNEYIQDVIKKYSSDLDVAIICFKDVLARRPKCAHGDPPKPIGKITAPCLANK